MEKKRPEKAIYSIADNMFRFWYRFVPENTSLIIARGAADLAYKRIEPYLSDYMGKVFEEICKQYLWKLLLSGKCPVEFSLPSAAGGATILSINDRQKLTFWASRTKTPPSFAECKWTNEKVDLGVLETLIERSNLFAYQKKHFFLFSKSGFTKGCIEKAKQLGNATLKTYADMIHDKGD